jgi:hypothetical protein
VDGKVILEWILKKKENELGSSSQDRFRWWTVVNTVESVQVL